MKLLALGLGLLTMSSYAQFSPAQPPSAVDQDKKEAITVILSSKQLGKFEQKLIQEESTPVEEARLSLKGIESMPAPRCLKCYSFILKYKVYANRESKVVQVKVDTKGQKYAVGPSATGLMSVIHSIKRFER